MKRQAYGFRDPEFLRLKILGIHETTYALAVISHHPGPDGSFSAMAGFFDAVDGRGSDVRGGWTVADGVFPSIGPSFGGGTLVLGPLRAHLFRSRDSICLTRAGRLPVETVDRQARPRRTMTPRDQGHSTRPLGDVDSRTPATTVRDRDNCSTSEPTRDEPSLSLNLHPFPGLPS